MEKMNAANNLNLAKIYMNESTSDIIFKLKNENDELVEFPAHKAILNAQSEVFEKMFYTSDIRELGPSISIPDCTAEAFGEFLQLFYMSNVQLSTKYLPEVLGLVDKYDAKEFWTIIEQFFITSANASVAYLYYELSKQHNLPRVLEKLMTVICDDPLTALSHGGSSSAVLATILKSEQMKWPEIFVFESALAWAKRSISYKEITATNEAICEELRDCVRYIRFPTMSGREFLQCLDKCPELLSFGEFTDILHFIIYRRPLRVGYNVKKRSEKYTLKLYETEYKVKCNTLKISLENRTDLSFESVVSLCSESSKELRINIADASDEHKKVYEFSGDLHTCRDTNFSANFVFTLRRPIVFVARGKYDLHIRRSESQLLRRTSFNPLEIPNGCPLKFSVVDGVRLISRIDFH